jgi:hypothetical protein
MPRVGVKPSTTRRCESQPCVYEVKLIQGSKSREHDLVKLLTFEECRKIRSNILTSSQQRLHIDAVMDQALQLSQLVTRKYTTIIEVQTVDPDGAKWNHFLSRAEIVSVPNELESTLIRCIGCRHVVNRDFTIGLRRWNHPTRDSSTG